MTAAPQSGTTPAQVFMTLSAIAATAATRRPSGESREDHLQRIERGITAQLGDASLATGGTWRLEWLGLTPDNGNLAYIASNSASSGEFALAVRGTVFSNPIDLAEDFEVGETVPFDVTGAPADAWVSRGAGEAFELMVRQPGSPLGAASTDGPGVASAGVTLQQALDDFTGRGAGATVRVTGHSLGGCVATMLGPYLQAQGWQQRPQFSLITFAAPTAGGAGFATYVDTLSWNLAERHLNAYDVIPLAWSDIPAAENWYPSPGPAADAALLARIDSFRKGNVYVQPGAPMAVNCDYSVRGTAADDTFLGQVAFQHANATYLGLLGAPLTPAGPVVTEVSPASGAAGSRAIVLGSDFTGDSVVDFGRVPVPHSDTTVNSPGQITVKVPPHRIGEDHVAVRVTNMYGTSSAKGGSFSYT